MADGDDENGTSPWLQLAALRAERDELLALLREVEWTPHGCPVCGRSNHAPDCRLKAALERRA